MLRPAKGALDNFADGDLAVDCLGALRVGPPYREKIAVDRESRVIAIHTQPRS